jgi:peptidoglycan-associated lipoprotein
VGGTDVPFEANQTQLTDAARLIVERNAAELMKHPEYRVVLEGHVDEGERVSDQDALELGRARALMVKQVLVQAGIAPSRLSVTSFARARPFCADATGRCVEGNSRVSLKVRFGAGPSQDPRR